MRESRGQKKAGWTRSVWRSSHYGRLLAGGTKPNLAKPTIAQGRWADSTG